MKQIIERLNQLLLTMKACSTPRGSNLQHDGWIDILEKSINELKEQLNEVR